MDVMEFHKKYRDICSNHRLCAGCPLANADIKCAIYLDTESFNTIVSIVEDYEETKFPFGRCRICGKEFNSELRSEYDITHCPWCGERVEG